VASKIDIVNLALALLGEPTIIALDDTSKAARVMNLHVDSNRDEVLRAHPWNFAVTRASLAALLTAPAFGPANAFKLPGDFLRLLEFNPSTLDDYRLELVDSTRVLVTDADSADIIYIQRVKDTGLFDAAFVAVLAAKLAEDTAIALTSSIDLRNTLREVFRNRLSAARSADAQENPPTDLVVDDFLQARLGGGRFRPIEDP